MATIVQQITWQLDKPDLEALLQTAGGNYTALQFSMAIDDSSATVYTFALVNNGGIQQQSSEAGSLQVVAQKEACPVPPGCPSET